MKRIAVSILCAATVAGVGVMAQESPSPVAVPVMWVGHDSKVTQESVERITGQGRWAQVWAEHSGKDLKGEINPSLPDDVYRYTNDLQLPRVNFDTHMVVAVFGGSTQTSAGFEVSEARDLGERLQIRVNHRPFGSVGKRPTYKPYGFFVLPKTSKPISLQKDVKRIKNAPPEWQPWKELN